MSTVLQFASDKWTNPMNDDTHNLSLGDWTDLHQQQVRHQRSHKKPHRRQSFTRNSTAPRKLRESRDLPSPLDLASASNPATAIRVFPYKTDLRLSTAFENDVS